MPKATVPVGHSGMAPTKPAGFGKPTGFGKVVEAEDEPARPSPLILTLSVLALLLSGWFVFAQYQTDQMLGRMLDRERMFGTPEAKGGSSSSSSSSDYSDEDGSYDESSDDEYSDDEYSDDESSASDESSEDDSVDDSDVSLDEEE